MNDTHKFDPWKEFHSDKPRRRYWREYYQANRDKKRADAKARRQPTKAERQEASQ